MNSTLYSFLKDSIPLEERIYTMWFSVFTPCMWRAFFKKTGIYFKKQFYDMNFMKLLCA